MRQRCARHDALPGPKERAVSRGLAAASADAPESVDYALLQFTPASAGIGTAPADTACRGRCIRPRRGSAFLCATHLPSHDE
jgi:hypothetical protein